MLNSSAKRRFETQESYLEPLPSSTLVWLLGSLCNLLQIPFKQSQLLQQFPPPYSLATLHEASSAFGLTAGVVSITEIDWKQLPLPAVAFLKPVGGMSLDVKQSNEDSEPEGCIPILILKRDDKTLLFFREGSKTPETLSVSEAAQYLSANLVLVAKQDGDTSSPEDIDGFEEEKKTFGFKWFVPELLKHKSIWKDVLLASFSIQLVGLATPLFTQVIIDKVIAHQSMSTLYVLAAALIMFMIFTSIMTWLRQYLVLHTGNRIDAVLGSQVFRHLLRLPLPYFERRPTGTLVARLQGIETIRQFITGAAVTLLLDLPFLLIFLAIMFAYSWQLSLIALAVLSVIGLMSFAISPLLRERLNKQFMLGAQNQAFLTEYLSGISTVKSLQMEPNVERKYSNIFAKYLSAGFRAKQVSNTYNVIANTLEQAMTLSILFVGALIVMKNDGFTIGMLVAFQMFASRMSQPMLRLVGLWQEFQQANIAVKRLGDILDMPQEPHSLLPSREGKGTGILELSNLGFRYSENHPWLYRSLNLKVEPGKVTVIMGASGSGKSTLTKLIQGFYLPQEGHIKLDGQDIRMMPANELRTFFGVVPQETMLFSGTVYDNLIVASPHASFNDVVHACKAAGIHETIEQLPQGYQTNLGEHGTGLSGGQKQRISIARALIKKPKILVFDEATSNLDKEVAEKISETINELKKHAGVVFVTHDAPNCLIADNMIVL